jgi:hypothetical protein
MQQEGMVSDLDFSQQPRQERVMPDRLQKHGTGESKKSRSDRAFRERLFETQGGKCHWCKEPMELTMLRCTEFGKWKDNPRFASFDHLIPKSKGGIKGRMNIVLAHSSCNWRRAKRQWEHDPIYGPNAKWHYAKGKRLPGPPPKRA